MNTYLNGETDFTERQAILERALERERAARKEAEKILEEKSSELYILNRGLRDRNDVLDNQISYGRNELTRIAGLSDHNPHPIIQYDYEDNLLYLNSAAKSVFGGALADMKGSVDPVINEVMQEGEKAHKEFYFGKRLYSVVGIPSKLLLGCDLYFTDITGERDWARRLENSEVGYKRIVEGASDLIIKTNLAGEILFGNSKSCELFNLPQKTLTGMRFEQLLVDDNCDIFDEIRTYNTELDTVMKQELQFLLPDNSKPVFECRAYLNRDEIIIISRDITIAKKAEEKLLRSEQKYKSVIENMKLGLLEVDNNNVITSVYSRFCELTGYSESELLGKRAVDVLLKDSSTRTQILVHQETRLKGKGSVYEAKIFKKDGTEAYFLISGAPLYNELGDVSGSIGIHLDITSRKKTELELIEQRHRAEASNHAKEQFLANMSHEIRTPMNAIIGMSEILSKSKIAGRELKLIESIEASSKNLLVIINDILDLSKVESGKMTLERVGFDVRKLFSHIDQANRLRAEGKGVLLILKIDADVPEILIGDPVRLNQVVTNLVSNAIKFTDRGAVTIDVALNRSRHNIAELKVSVSDTGKGIKKELQDRLFTPFDQGDNSISRKYGGTGLGLSITQKLVSLQGGKMQFSSVEGVGSTFSFQIPYPKGQRKDLPDDLIEKVNLNGLVGMNVLLAEDNEFNQTLIETLFIEHKVNLDIVKNGKEAIRKIEAENYDLVLMDIQMPIMGGLEAAKNIRGMMGGDLPIIALTANAFSEDRAMYIREGMNDCVSKPFVANQLYYTMLKHTGRLNWESEDSTLPKSEECGSISEKQNSTLYSLDKLRLMANGNEEFVTKMINSFLKHTPAVLNQMQQALEKRDTKKLSSLAHRLKSGVRLFDVACVEQNILEVEKKAETESIDYISDSTIKVLDGTRKLLEELKSYNV